MNAEPRQLFLLVELPHLVAFRNAVTSSVPPFTKLLEHLKRETGRDLGFLQVAISPADHAELCHEAERWAVHRRSCRGLPVREVREHVGGALSVEGLTCPRVNPHLPPGLALVAAGVAP